MMAGTDLAVGTMNLHLVAGCSAWETVLEEAHLSLDEMYESELAHLSFALAKYGQS